MPRAGSGGSTQRAVPRDGATLVRESLGGMFEHTVDALDAPFAAAAARMHGDDMRVSMIQSPLLAREADDGGPAAGGATKGGGAKLGTFLGVFVPTMNTIFGVVVFLRWGWAVGQAGLGQVLVMLLIGHAIALLTCASVSAVCTNGEVGPGGAYYIISRALGPEFGGSIGALFYIAQATGVAFYLLGLAETVLETYHISPVQELPYLPDEWGGLDPSGHAKYGDTVLVSSGALLLIFCISMLGSSIFAKASMAIFTVIVSALFGSLASFVLYSADSDHVQGLNFTGISSHTLHDNLHADFACPEPCDDPGGLGKGGFAGSLAVFSIVLPSMTGILAGANMSGDLADPGRAIPLGTFAAIFFMFLSYTCVILLNAATVQRGELQSNYEIMQDVCFSPVLVFVGTLCTTFSSALSGLVGTARVLQAMALDFPALEWFAKVSASDGEPRRAIVISYILAQCTLFLGKVNTIAPIVGNFMLVMFVVLNLACATLELTEAPNFRPSYRLYSWKGAMLGAVLSFVTMFALNKDYAIVTCFIVAILFVYISVAATHSTKLSADWGDVNQGLLFRFTTQFLLRLDVRKVHVKFWQPQILLVQPPEDDDVLKDSVAGPLISFAADLKNTGTLTVGHIIVGELENNLDRIEELLHEREALKQSVGVKAFTEVTVAPSMSLGVQQLTMSAGIGALRPNTVLLGMMSPAGDGSPSVVAEYVGSVRAALSLRKTVLIARGFEVFSRDNVSSLLEATTDEWSRMARIDISGHGPRAGGRIDVWLPPFGSEGVGAQDEEARVLVTLQLAQILHSVPFWASNTRLRCCVLTTADAAQTQEARLREIMRKSRMYFDLEVITIEKEPAFRASFRRSQNGGTADESVEVVPEPEPAPAGESAYSRHIADLEFLSSLQTIERNRLLNLMIRKHTLRNSALVFIHQDYFNALCGSTKGRDAESEAGWVEACRALTDQLPCQTLLVSPNANQVTSSEM